MKQKYYLAFFLVSLAWLAFTMCPPWTVTCFDSQWMPQSAQFYGYGFIFAPVNVGLEPGAELHIDFVLLALKYLASAVLIAVLTLRVDGPLIGPGIRASQFKMRLAVMSIVCLVVSGLLLKQEAIDQLQIAKAPRGEMNGCYYSLGELPPGAVRNPELASAAKKNLPTDRFINKDSLIF